jgi:rhodanese-related sulfurtransferase
MTFKSKYIGIIVALVISTVIFFLPAKENAKFVPDLADIDTSMQALNQKVLQQTLLDWVIEGNRDYLLIDVRNPAEYAKGHIKTAQNIPLVEFTKRATLEEIPEGKRIIIYSNSNNQSSRAWVALNRFGLDAYVLDGGYSQWDQLYLNPQVPGSEATEQEIQQYKTRIALKNYFTGKSLDGAAATVQLPVPKKKALRGPKKKKKKLGGC